MATAELNIETKQSDASMAEFEASEKAKWDALNAHMTPQFEGVKMYVEHVVARYRVAYVGNPSSMYVPDPDVGEMKALTGKSLTPENREFWRQHKNKHIKDVDPEYYERICEQQDGLAAKMRECGVKVIRNDKMLEYPEAMVNFNANWRGPKFLSFYAGPHTKIMHHIWMQCCDCGPVRTHEFSLRQGTAKLLEQNPNLIHYQLPYPEPDVNMMGPGLLNHNNACFRLMPNKHVLFGVGVSKEDDIPLTYDLYKGPPVTSSGTAYTAKYMMERYLERHGYTYEIAFFDSNLTYHHDCLMMNLKEGYVGLPDDGKWGHWSGLPECIKDWEIVPIPPHEISQFGVANAVAIGDGRVIMDERATGTMDAMSKVGLEPIPLPYDAPWNAYGSGMECSDEPYSRWDDGNEPDPSLWPDDV